MSRSHHARPLSVLLSVTLAFSLLPAPATAEMVEEAMGVETSSAATTAEPAPERSGSGKGTSGGAGVESEPAAEASESGAQADAIVAPDPPERPESREASTGPAYIDVPDSAALEPTLEPQEAPEQKPAEEGERTVVVNLESAVTGGSVDDLARALKEAKAARDARQADKNAAAAALERAKAEQTTANAAYDSAKQAHDVAKQPYDAFLAGGSVAFFDKVGSTTASGYLTNTTATEGPVSSGYYSRPATTFASHTTIGGEHDATSLQNMLDAIAWIKYCNEIRAKQGLSALLVTDELMASAQRNANFSTEYYDHAREADGTSMNMADYNGGAAAENLYVTSVGVEQAYRGWFYDEKDLWEEIVAQDPGAAAYWLNSYGLREYLGYYANVGHYFNLANPAYRYTGIGLNSTGSEGAAIQQFRSKAETTAYTVEDYEQRFMAYWGDAKNAYDAAVKKLNSATTTKRDADNKVTTAQTRYDDADKALRKAQETVDAMQAAYDEAVENAVLSRATITASDCLYTGSEVTPRYKVVLDGHVLRRDVDYRVWNPSDLVSVGEKKATFEGIGVYSGRGSATFYVLGIFPDVPADAWHARVVGKAAALGLVSGYADGRFGPGDRITRGQAAVILWNMAGSPAAGSGARDFPDVRSDKYYYNAVRWASSAGVVSGYADGRFGPNDNVTREQLAVMLANYSARVAGKPAAGSASDYASMGDHAKVSRWAVSAVGWCFRNKILSGSKGNVVPQGTAARAEAAKMVVGLHDLVA